MKLITFQSIFDTPTVKMGKLNEEGQTPDGRVWEYLQATEGISQYMIVSNPSNTGVDDVASSTNKAGQSIYIKKAAASWTEGAYQDHWFLVDAGTGEGQLGKIKDNTDDTLELYVDYALSTALTLAGTSDIVIRHYPDVEMAVISNEILPLKGVAQVAFLTNDYGWFLKRGIGGVLCDVATTINFSLTAGDTGTEGTAIYGTASAGLYDENYVGRILVPNTSSDKASLVDINIL